LDVVRREVGGWQYRASELERAAERAYAVLVPAMSKYSRDLAKSARRHLATASHLDQEECRAKHGAIAGYLLGIAAECAMKEMMRDSGMRLSMSALFDGDVSAKFDGFPVSRPYGP
jgi:hypothetical protein